MGDEIFTAAERTYLESQRLARLATIGPDGGPQVRPVGFVFDADAGTVDIGGPRLTASRKYRNVEANPLVSLVVDDMTPDEPGAVKPGWGRGVEIRGRAETLTLAEPPMAPGFFANEVIRIHPVRIISWHLDPDHLDDARTVGEAPA
ncbi:PPOX class F420-dependent oxidoreductase [Actinocatenispora thailandica]|uniref:PPOX class F420-dependent oxidoreductase n=1 Tax=Actinocatenispora thailandica TaxID=227318 RepID=A0A7R7HV88_9ACTN|nr:PPOX class F420-dependent oxidoreductase [Actinocatenispora thailandica]BCJ33306.1 PPOX class F420-dependent oxidoreductase [Actinocatenispora thailandica]